MSMKRKRKESFGSDTCKTLKTDRSYFLEFDHILIIRHEKVIKQLSKSLKSLGYEVKSREELITFLIAHLRKALGERVLQLSSVPSPAKHDIVIGFQINPDLYHVNLDRGPKHGTPEAATFREFWGSRADLRHAVGEVRECVLWPGGHVFQSVIDYVLQEQLGCTPNASAWCQVHCQLRPLLHISTSPHSEPWEQTLSHFHLAFGKLTRQILELKAYLPLSVNSVTGTSAAFRGAPLFAPRTLQQRHTCLLHLESSGKWPSLLQPFLAMKSLYHLHLAKLLRSRCKLSVTVCAEFLLVRYQGYVFQMSVAVEKEIGLRKQAVNDLGVIVQTENPGSRLATLSLQLVPPVCGAVRGLCSQFCTFTETTRLAKRWLSCHLLLNEVLDELVVELLCGLIYLRENTLCSGLRGFLLFLHFMSVHDFNSEPVIINLNSLLSHTEMSDIREHFVKNRSRLPPLFLATPYDKLESLFTAEFPSSKLLQRIQRFAKVSYKFLDAHLLTADRLTDLKMAFRPPLHTFDVVIHIKKRLVPLAHFSVDPPNNLKLHRNGLAPVKKDSLPLSFNPDFHPVKHFASLLTKQFSDQAFFCYNLWGFPCIGALLKSPLERSVLKEQVKAWVRQAPEAVEKVEIIACK